MKGFVFLLVMLLLFCESTVCSKALDPLLSNVAESDVQLSVQLYKQTRVCPPFTVAPVSSLLSVGPCETFGALSVSYSDMYLHLHFLRSLNGFDVFIKSHSREADIHTFILDCD